MENLIDVTKINPKILSDLGRERLIETLINQQFDETFEDFIKDIITVKVKVWDETVDYCSFVHTATEKVCQQIIRIFELATDFKFAKKHQAMIEHEIKLKF
ncbi:hypothetical protein [Candidatus Phytoplasma pyri]|uniref:hypothetical protein n=1 Tax=Candidatus Phytoplasma pyri TaxID=47566 RepID=UPI003982DC31